MSAVVCGLSIIKYKLVSSANNSIVDCMSITMSFIKVIKKIAGLESTLGAIPP
jgi:hypothetical protein